MRPTAMAAHTGCRRWPFRTARETSALSTPIAGAYLERSPVVVISGGPSQKNIDDQNATGVLYSHSMGKPHTDLDIFRNITAFCQRETDETKLPKLIDDAIKAALVTKHPVYLEAPKDLFSRPCSPPAAPIDTTVARRRGRRRRDRDPARSGDRRQPGRGRRRGGGALRLGRQGADGAGPLAGSVGRPPSSANRFCPNSIRASMGCSTATRRPPR